MAKFCSRCGASCGDTQAFCPRCGNRLPPAQQPYGQQRPPYGQQPPQIQQYGYGPVLGMNWYKFIIYFALFATAVLYVVTGIIVMTGGQYDSVFGNVSALVYAIYPSLKTADMLYGICLIVLAAGAIYVRMRLAAFRANGPKLYLILLGAAIAAGFIYLVIVFTVTGADADSVDLSSYSVQLVYSIVMVIVNSIYFKKRAHLFVN